MSVKLGLHGGGGILHMSIIVSNLMKSKHFDVKCHVYCGQNSDVSSFEAMCRQFLIMH